MTCLLSTPDGVPSDRLCRRLELQALSGKSAILPSQCIVTAERSAQGQEIFNSFRSSDESGWIF